MTHQDYWITFNVPSSLEENFVDRLLLFESKHGFNSVPVHDHHHQSQGLSLAEQVRGRQKKIRFQIVVDADQLSQLLIQIKQEFAGAGIQYWVVPVIERGFI